MLKYFWMSVVVYTMLVLILVYTFQFESSINVWSNMTGMSREKYAFKTSSDMCMCRRCCGVIGQLLFCAGWKISVWRSSPFLLCSRGSSFPLRSFWSASFICTISTSASSSSPTSNLRLINRRALSPGAVVTESTK